MKRRVSEYAATELRTLRWAGTETEMRLEDAVKATTGLEMATTCVVCTESGQPMVECGGCGQGQCRYCLLREAKPYLRPTCPFCRAEIPDSVLLATLEAAAPWLEYQSHGYLAYQPPSSRPIPLLRRHQAAFLTSLHRALRRQLLYYEADLSFRPHRYYPPDYSEDNSAPSLSYHSDPDFPILTEPTALTPTAGARFVHSDFTRYFNLSQVWPRGSLDSVYADTSLRDAASTLALHPRSALTVRSYLHSPHPSRSCPTLPQRYALASTSSRSFTHSPATLRPLPYVFGSISGEAHLLDPSISSEMSLRAGGAVESDYAAVSLRGAYFLPLRPLNTDGRGPNHRMRFRNHRRPNRAESVESAYAAASLNGLVPPRRPVPVLSTSSATTATASGLSTSMRDHNLTHYSSFTPGSATSHTFSPSFQFPSSLDTFSWS